MSNYYDTVDINKVVTLKYGTSKGCYFGCGAISKFAGIVDDLKPSYFGFVCSKSAHIRSGAFAAVEKVLTEKKIPYIVYDKIVANPMTDSIDEATKIFREKYNSNFVVCSIGGGSPGDAAKCVSTLLEHPNNNAAELFSLKFAPTKRSKLVMINLTSGTGTEVDLFAVGSISNANPPAKPAIGYPSFYADYSIDDPILTKTTSEFQTRYTAIDALNHAMEACSTLIATPFSVTLARQISELVTKYLPTALKEPDNLRARYWLMYAAALGGMAFDESLLHLTHGLEHVLSAVIPDLTHGLGLALLQPGVLRHTWSSAGPVFVHCFSEILTGLTGKPDEAQKAFDLMRAWHVSVGAKESMASVGFKKEQLDALVDGVYATPGAAGLVGLSPVPTGKNEIKQIYASGFFE